MMGRRSSTFSLCLDSLLDTMTNGVGILIVVLCVTQVELGRVLRHTQERPRVDADDLGALKRQEGELAASVKPLRERWQVAESRQRQDARTIGELEKLLPELDKKANTPSAGPGTRELVEKKESLQLDLELFVGQIKQKDGDLKALQGTLAALQKKSEPTKGPDPTRQRALPQIHTLSPNTKSVAFYCRRGQVFPLNFKEFGDKLLSGVRTSIGARPGNIVLRPEDHPRVVQYFATHDIGDRFFRIQMSDAAFAVKMTLALRPTAKGESIEEIQNPTSSYARAIGEARASVARKESKVMTFFVWADAFPTYLTARRLSDDSKLPGRWVPYALDEEYDEFLGVGGAGPPTGE